MRHWKAVLAVVAMAGMLAVGASAQLLGRVSGKVIDMNGKPWPGVTVIISSPSTGAKYTVTTNSKGEYMQMGVTPGIYKITFETKKFPPQTYEVRVAAGSPLTQNINFKKLIAANPKYVAAMKKAAAEKKAFANLKKHFDTGRKAIDQASALSNKLSSQPAAQQAQTRQQIAQLSQTAITELTAAEKAAGPTNSNLPTILGNLALAYQTAGDHTKAAATFAKASQMQPTNPGYLLGAATNLAYTGKTKEASANCQKITTISVPTAATCWRNLGVVLYNTNHLKDAIAPLKEATKADPTDADTWYLLGSALMNSMQSKMVNGKLTAIVAPGTVEAYEKYLQLAPNGPQAGAAKQALQVLHQLGAGVNTKFIAHPKRH